MGGLARFVLWMFKKLSKEGPQRIDVKKVLREHNMPGDRRFVMILKEEPMLPLYFRMVDGRMVFGQEPHAYDARIHTSVKTLLDLADGTIDVNRAMAWGEVTVIPEKEESFTAYDIEVARRILKEFLHVVVEIITGKKAPRT